MQAGSLNINVSANETAFHVFKHSGSCLSRMLKFSHGFTFCFADSVSACSMNLLLFWKTFFVLFPDPCLNVYIFSFVYVRHQFLILTPFYCTVIQSLKELRWKRNCQAITHPTKVKESQRSLHVLEMKLWFPH